MNTGKEPDDNVVIGTNQTETICSNDLKGCIVSEKMLRNFFVLWKSNCSSGENSVSLKIFKGQKETLLFTESLTV